MNYRPRAWQKNAVDRCVSIANAGADRALICACPGSGKTIGGLLVANGLRDRAKRGPRVVVLTPNLAIKSQWIDRSADLGLNLLPVTDAHELHKTVGDMFSHGYILTYQQAVSMRNSLRLFCDTHKPIAILDEVHHTSGPLGQRDGNAWGVTVEHSLHNASFKLCTTGTPFREGPNPIAFVDYSEEGKATAHVEYGYAQAINDRVCRPIWFQTYDGDMEWRDSKGVSSIADFSTKLTQAKSRERLRAAVSMDGQFPIRMLKEANDRLLMVRQEPGSEDAGGLIVAMDVDHAEAIATEMTTICGRRPIVVHNRIDDSLDQINAFRDGDEPWIIGVQMLSEGVDIPRLRVGVYCTNVRATLYFHQFCGRMTRVQSSNLERAYIYLPADPELEATARQIEEERVHALGEDRPPADGPPRSRKAGAQGIVVEESESALASGIFSGRAIPADYLDRHMVIINDYRSTSPSFRNLPDGEIVLFLVKAGVLPTFEQSEAA